MKALAVLSLVLFFHVSFSQELLSVPEREVPVKVLKKFDKKYSEIENETWHPYPNRFVREGKITPTLLPLFWNSATPDYYEVRFNNGKNDIRIIYEAGGSWRVTSKVMNINELPVEISNQLDSKGYSEWQKLRVELVSKTREEGVFYKVWLTHDKRKRIFFFNENYEIVKTLKWDNDINFYVKEKAKLAEAPDSRRLKKTIPSGEVPKVVRSKAKENHVKMEVIEWSVRTRVYDPLGKFGTSYYDITLPAFYQVILSDGTERFKAIYSAQGELLEVAQIITRKQLPDPIKKVFKSDTYTRWKFSEEHDKIEVIPGAFAYRVYGVEDKVEKVLLLDSSGQLIWE